MSLLSAAYLAAALAAPGADAPAASPTAVVSFSLGDTLLSRRPLLLADEEMAAAQTYFDADALISLGALALAVGGLAAAASLNARRQQAAARGAGTVNAAPRFQMRTAASGDDAKFAVADLSNSVVTGVRRVV